MIVYRICHSCHVGHDPRIASCECESLRRLRNAQVSDSEASAVAIHPVTGEKVYCFHSPSDPLPERYASLGFEKVQFKSMRALRKFCDANGQVNDMEYDNKYDGYGEEMAKVRDESERKRGEAYRRERELAIRAGVAPLTIEKGRRR